MPAPSLRILTLFFPNPHSIMPVFAEALDNIAKYHVGVNYIHTQEGSLMMNYRLIPPLGPCLLNLIALLKILHGYFSLD